MNQNLKTKIFTTIIDKYPSFRDERFKSCLRWLEGREKDDNAEGFWRIHDKIYDFSDFVKSHPGGSEWIELTKGTDITEAFESYHIQLNASQIAQKYFLKDADKPRNYFLTFNEDGFYRTIKRKVAEKFPNLDRKDCWKSKFYLDLIVFGFFISSIISVRADLLYVKIICILVAAQCTAWMNAAVHNFTHQRNNWRMYAANFIIFGWRDWRVHHGISHHLYPNSYADMEISSYEPFHNWIPIKPRTKLQVALSRLSVFITYPVPFFYAFLCRLNGFFKTEKKIFHWDDLLMFVPPFAMFLAGNSSLTVINIISIAIIYTIIMMLGGTIYSINAINAGHHGYTVVHEGDEFKDLDFGIYQLLTTTDRIGTTWNLFVALTNFGDHVLHHLFPTLDQALLPQLRDVLDETCEEFEVELRKWTFYKSIKEQFLQLARTNVFVEEV